MRRGFTLIELLVVVMILAILSAILFPVYAHAKSQAKRSVEASQLHEIGMAGQMYLADFDDVYFPRKIIGAGGVIVPAAQAINPDYQKIRKTQGQAMADQLFGPKTRNVEFFSQLLDPYINSVAIWISPGNQFAWSGFDPIGDMEDPAFRSYGGQNSYGVNLNIFSQDTESGATGGMTQNSLDDPSRLLVMTSAGYYVVASRTGLEMPSNEGGPESPVAFDACREPFYSFWKNAGNGRWAKWNSGTLTFDPIADSAAEKDPNSRFYGYSILLYGDTHVTVRPWFKFTYPLTTVTGSGDDRTFMWDPSDDLSTATPCGSALPDNDPDGYNR